MSTQKTDSLPVRFIAQGGREYRGRAIGRKGRSLLIRYRIQSGEPRERWFGPKRIIELEGDIDALARYRGRSCPGYELEERVAADAPRVACEKCGEVHQAARAEFDLFYVDTGEVIERLEGWHYGPGSFRREIGTPVTGTPREGHRLNGREVDTRGYILAFSSLKLPDEPVG